MCVLQLLHYSNRLVSRFRIVSVPFVCRTGYKILMAKERKIVPLFGVVHTKYPFACLPEICVNFFYEQPTH